MNEIIQFLPADSMGWFVAGVAVLAVLGGWLVPKWVVRETDERAKYWRQAAEQNAERADIADEQLNRILDADRVTLDVVESIRRAVRMRDEQPRP